MAADPDKIRELLAAAGEQLADLRGREAVALQTVEGLVHQAHVAGLNISEIAQLGRVSRPTVYRVLGETPSE